MAVGARSDEDVQPHVVLAGIDNFRDFGGYAVGARVLPRGRLFRSAHLARATQHDLDDLDHMGLKLIVDLRKSGERMRDRTPEALQHYIFSGNDEESGYAPHEAYVHQRLTSANARAIMREWYRHALFEPQLVAIFRLALPAIAACDGAVLIHCAAGKDRTGLFVGMIQHVLGVHQDDIVAEYLLTNVHVQSRGPRPEATAMLSALYGQALPDDVVAAFAQVHELDLAEAWEAAARECGSLDIYLAQVLGVSGELRETLVRRLLG